MKKQNRFLVFVLISVSSCFAISCATLQPLHQAAARGNVHRIDKYVNEKGISVSATDELGNTPLHYAYYNHKKEAVERLIALSADQNIRNNEGNSPFDMSKLASAEKLIATGARCLDKHGNWTDRSTGREVYDELRSEMEMGIVIQALVRMVLKDKRRLQVLFLAVKLGLPGSERRLIDILEAYGDKKMAEDYLNCGSTALFEGAKDWANRHGYNISTGMGSHRVGWGRF